MALALSGRDAVDKLSFVLPNGRYECVDAWLTYDVKNSKFHTEARKSDPAYKPQITVNTILKCQRYDEDGQPAGEPMTQRLNCCFKGEGWFDEFGNPGTPDKTFRVLDAEFTPDGTPLVDSMKVLEPNTEEDANGKIGEQPQGNLLDVAVVAGRKAGQISPLTEMGRFLNNITDLKGTPPEGQVIHDWYTCWPGMVFEVANIDREYKNKKTGEMVKAVDFHISKVIAWPWEKPEWATRYGGDAPVAKPAAAQPSQVQAAAAAPAESTGGGRGRGRRAAGAAPATAPVQTAQAATSAPAAPVQVPSSPAPASSPAPSATGPEPLALQCLLDGGDSLALDGDYPPIEKAEYVTPMLMSHALLAKAAAACGTQPGAVIRWLKAVKTWTSPGGRTIKVDANNNISVS